MKKYLLNCVLVFALSFNSCSNEESEKKENVILPKTLKTTYPNNPSENFVTTIIYDGSKIMSIRNKNEKIDYLYEGNYIGVETKYNFVNGQEVKYSETFYKYENDSLQTVTKQINDQKTKYIYTYNSDETITKETYTLDNETKKELKNSEKDVLTIDKGNLTNSVFNSGNQGIVSTSRYDYDTNNNAFKNVLGLNLLLDQAGFGTEKNISSGNNLKKYNISRNYVPDIIFEPFSFTMKYEYNENGYPTKKTIYDYTGKVTAIVEYKY